MTPARAGTTRVARGQGGGNEDDPRAGGDDDTFSHRSSAISG